MINGNQVIFGWLSFLLKVIILQPTAMIANCRIIVMSLRTLKSQLEWFHVAKIMII